jgi:glycogen synthase
MKNGTIPILTRVGGLADFVEDGKTGFLIDLVLHENKVDTDVEKSRQAVLDGFRRALDIYHNQSAKLDEMRRACMAQDNSWELRMPVYERLFRYLRGRGDQALARSRSDSRVGFLTSVGTPIEDLLGFYEKISIDDSSR